MLSVSLILNSDGQPAFFFAQIQDIGELKRTEEALRESDKRFQAFLDHSPNLIFIKDLEGRYQLVNKECDRAFGIDQNQIIGKKDEELFSMQQAAAFQSTDLQVLKVGAPVEFEEEFIQTDGSRTSIVHKFPLFGPDEKIYAIGGIVTDITQRKRAEEELRRREEEQRQLIQNVPEVVWKADERGKVFFIHKEIEKLFGYSLDQIYREGEQLWFGRMHSDDRESVRTAYAQLFQENRPFDVEYRIQHRDGHWMWWHDRAASVSGAKGHAVAEGLLSEITERKQNEQSLRQRQKMEAIGQLAGGVAHDFNNLLTVIKGNHDILAGVPELNNQQRRSIEQIGKAADRAAELTRQLLAFSRMQVLQPKVLDLNDIVSDLSKMLPRLISEDIEFLFAPDPQLGKVKADPGQLEQVILNLAVNARDAMPQGGKLVVETKNVAMDEESARRHHPARAGQYVLLMVSDTGTGMDADTQSHIFEPFFTTKQQGNGTGLGLATVYGIVKQSGGFIWVYSEPGRGTTFKVYLPRVDEPAEFIQQSKDPGAAIRGTETLLLVEDEKALRELVGEFLREHGYVVLEAKNGAEGQRVAEQHRGNIDLLVTDMVMPKMGGRELAERLMVQRPALKTLYLSGYSESVAAPDPEGFWNGVFLQKPFSMNTLGRKVREVLQRAEKHDCAQA